MRGVWGMRGSGLEGRDGRLGRRRREGLGYGVLVEGVGFSCYAGYWGRTLHAIIRVPISRLCI